MTMERANNVGAMRDAWTKAGGMAQQDFEEVVTLLPALDAWLIAFDKADPQLLGLRGRQLVRVHRTERACLTVFGEAITSAWVVDDLDGSHDRVWTFRVEEHELTVRHRRHAQSDGGRPSMEAQCLLLAAVAGRQG